MEMNLERGDDRMTSKELYCQVCIRHLRRRGGLETITARIGWKSAIFRVVHGGKTPLLNTDTNQGADCWFFNKKATLSTSVEPRGYKNTTATFCSSPGERYTSNHCRKYFYFQILCVSQFCSGAESRAGLKLLTSRDWCPFLLPGVRRRCNYGSTCSVQPDTQRYWRCCDFCHLRLSKWKFMQECFVISAGGKSVLQSMKSASVVPSARVPEMINRNCSVGTLSWWEQLYETYYQALIEWCSLVMVFYCESH